MTLIDADRAETLYAAMGAGIEASGGSAANTISGIASFGGTAAYIGRVFDDQLGTVFAHDLRATGVVFRSPPATDGPPTGRCLIVVTPDAQRTMNTYLGSSEFLGPEHVDVELIAGRAGHLPGGLPLRPAPGPGGVLEGEPGGPRRRAGGSASPCRTPSASSATGPRGATSWRTRSTSSSPTRRRRWRSTRSTPSRPRWPRRGPTWRWPRSRVAPLGSVVARGDEVSQVAAHPVEKVVDTTGAGDLYAAGFLFGFTRDRSMAACGRLGSVAASAVIGHTGPRPGLVARAAGGHAPALMADPWALVDAAATAVSAHTGVEHHEVAVVLGSGWASAADRLGEVVAEVAMGDLPGFVRAERRRPRERAALRAGRRRPRGARAARSRPPLRGR